MKIKMFIISMLAFLLGGCPSYILNSNYLHSIKAGHEVDNSYDPLKRY